MLETFNAWIDHAMGIQGDDGQTGNTGARSAAVPMPPGVPMWCSERLRPSLDALGYRQFPFPAAVNSRPFDGRPACVDCGSCSGGRANNAKGSPAVTTSHRALLSNRCELRSQTRVVHIVTNASGSEVTGLECLEPNGERVTVRTIAICLPRAPSKARACVAFPRSAVTPSVAS